VDAPPQDGPPLTEQGRRLDAVTCLPRLAERARCWSALADGANPWPHDLRSAAVFRARGAVGAMSAGAVGGDDGEDGVVRRSGGHCASCWTVCRYARSPRRPSRRLPQDDTRTTRLLLLFIHNNS